jgi:hypothetical protein
LSNGWWALTSSIRRLWPADNVEWFRFRHRDWIEAYREPREGMSPIPDERYFIYGPGQFPEGLRPEYMNDMLEISDVGDSAILLLNPLVRRGEEWELWFLADWLPGASRYHSFRDFLTNEIRKGEEEKAK